MREEPSGSYEYKGYTIEIWPDTDAPDPRKGWDNLGTMACWHRRYTLGDVQPKHPPHEYLESIAPASYRNRPSRLKKWFDEQLILLDVYMYDHTGITINTTGFSCPWDSGQIGFIWMTMAQARKEWKGTSEEIRKRAEEYLRGEVETYDMYLRGDVYGYVVKDEDDEELDSLWGCWGYDHTKKEAEDYVDSLIKRTVKEMPEDARYGG